jgi:hypothetical protein
LDDFFRAEYKFRALANFLGDCQLEIDRITCHSSAAGGATSDIECFDDRIIGGFSQREDARRGVIPVPANEITGNFNGMLERWFNLFDQLGPVVNLYLFGKHNRFLDMNTIFLTLMQALERYHRSFHGGFFMPEDDYDANVRPALSNAIPQEVQGDFRQRLQAAIKFGYEFSLRRRLREAVALLPNTPAFAEAKSATHLNRSVDTRNALTHQIEDPHVQILEGGALYNAINIWREALFALALRTLQVPEVVIDLAVRRLYARRGSLFVP